MVLETPAKEGACELVGFGVRMPAAGWRSGSGAYLGHTPVDTACPALIQLAGTAKRQGGGAVGFLQGFAGALFVSTWGGQECGERLNAGKLGYH